MEATREAITIRPAQEADVSTMAGLLAELFSVQHDIRPDPERQQKGLSALLEAPGACALVAESGGAVVGMITVQRVVSVADGGAAGLLENLVVTGTMRGRGIGTRLLESATAWAREHGFARLQLLADRQKAGGLNFYRRMGWTGADQTSLHRSL